MSNKEDLQMTQEEIEALKKELTAAKSAATKATNKLKEVEQEKEAAANAPFDEEAYLKERVPYVVPLIDPKTPDKFVSVNGEKKLIQRGETVYLPRYVVNTLEEQRLQELKIMRMKQALQQRK